MRGRWGWDLSDDFVLMCVGVVITLTLIYLIWRATCDPIFFLHSDYSEGWRCQ